MTTPDRRMLGRRRPKLAPALMLARMLGTETPVHPASVGNLAEATFDLYGNDRYGDCGPVCVANQYRQVTQYLTTSQTNPTLDDVLLLYRESGNPNFDPNDPGGPGDGGVDMQTMLEALTEFGLWHGAGPNPVDRPVCFAKVDVYSPEQLRAAVAIFGSVLWGVNLEDAQRDQPVVWDYAPGTGEWGSHAVLCGGYGPGGFELISWGQYFNATNEFVSHQLEEAWVLVWPQHLSSGREFLANLDVATLEGDYTALTGRPFPVPITPPPPPVSSDPDRALAAVAVDWLTEHHYGRNAHMAEALRTWLSDKGVWEPVSGPNTEQVTTGPDDAPVPRDRGSTHLIVDGARYRPVYAVNGKAVRGAVFRNATGQYYAGTPARLVRLVPVQ